MKSIVQSSLSLIVLLALGGCSRQAELDVAPQRALGMVAAEETTELLGNKGRVVIVTADTSQFKIPGAEAQLDQFRQSLRSQSAMTVKATE